MFENWKKSPSVEVEAGITEDREKAIVEIDEIRSEMVDYIKTQELGSFGNDQEMIDTLEGQVTAVVAQLENLSSDYPEDTDLFLGKTTEYLVRYALVSAYFDHFQVNAAEAFGGGGPDYYVSKFSE
jgi:hypothetical protein